MSEIIVINDNKFKSIYVSYNFTLKLNKEEIASTVISCFALSKGCKKYRTSVEMEKYLSSLYGTVFDINVEKVGDLFNFEFRIECVNKQFLPNKEDVFKSALQFLYNVIYEPNIENELFDESIFEREKDYIISCIDKRKDEKIKYAISRAEELMIPDSTFGTFVYGNIEDAKKVTNTSSVKSYKNLLSNSLITVIISGNTQEYEDIEEQVNSIFKLKNDIDKKELFSKVDEKNDNKLDKPIEIREKMDTVQSVLCIGMKSLRKIEDEYFIANVYNAILGGTPSSKLFQNVREKESLAYTTRSRYYRFKKLFVIYAGIEEKKYEKAKTVIEKQIDDMKNGKITDIEIDAAKESLINDLKEWYDSKIALVKYKYINMVTQKDLEIDDMIQKIQKVTIEDVKNYAQNVNIELYYLLGGENNE